MKKITCGALVLVAFSAQAEVDYDDAVNRMNAAYLAYENGAYAMLDVETECWDAVSSADDAEKCIAMQFAGVFIEAAWAKKEGRQSAPDYRGDVAKQRLETGLANAKITAEEKQAAMDGFRQNTQRVIAGMMNVGALGR